MLPEKNKSYGEKKGRRGIYESEWAEKKAGIRFLKNWRKFNL